MSEQNIPMHLKRMYENGENLSAYLRNKNDANLSLEEIIDLSYDLQTGSYIKQMSDPEYLEFKEVYTKEIASIILEYCEPESVLEAGVGEGTTLSGVMRELSQNTVKYYGFDISWSRIAYAQDWLNRNKLEGANLCTGSLLNLPYSENSIDVIYTSHSMEPNGGNEIPILKELMRVTKKYLILLEPAYEFASAEGKERMDFHGYVKNIKQNCIDLGYTVVKHELFPHSARQLNPTAITVIKKPQHDDESVSNPYACPKYRTSLEKYDNFLFSPDGLTVYPIVLGIPCLRIENGIIASKLPDVLKQA